MGTMEPKPGGSTTFPSVFVSRGRPTILLFSISSAARPGLVTAQMRTPAERRKITHEHLAMNEFPSLALESRRMKNMAGEKLHEYDLYLCNYVLGNVREHRDEKGFVEWLREQV